MTFKAQAVDEELVAAKALSNAEVHGIDVRAQTHITRLASSAR